jgi:hypothetical protein
MWEKSDFPNVDYHYIHHLKCNPLHAKVTLLRIKRTTKMKSLQKLELDSQVDVA